MYIVRTICDIRINVFGLLVQAIVSRVNIFFLETVKVDMAIHMLFEWSLTN